MGCVICVLIVPGRRDFGSEVIHFHEDKATIVPVDPDLYRNSSVSLNPFLEFLATSPDLGTALANSGAVLLPDEDDEDPYFMDYSRLADLITAADPQNFILQYYTEIGDHPDEHLFLTVVNGVVIREATNYYDKDYRDNHKNTYPFMAAIQREFGLYGSWLANESRYFNFRSARTAFLNS